MHRDSDMFQLPGGSKHNPGRAVRSLDVLLDCLPDLAIVFYFILLQSGSSRHKLFPRVYFVIRTRTPSREVNRYKGTATTPYGERLCQEEGGVRCPRYDMAHRFEARPNLAIQFIFEHFPDEPHMISST